MEDDDFEDFYDEPKPKPFTKPVESQASMNKKPPLPKTATLVPDPVSIEKDGSGGNNDELNLDLSNLAFAANTDTSGGARQEPIKHDKKQRQNSASDIAMMRQRASSNPVQNSTVKQGRPVAKKQLKKRMTASDNSCSSCSSASSSYYDEEEIDSKSDVTSVSPLASPYASVVANAREMQHQESPRAPSSDDIYALMRRIQQGYVPGQKSGRRRGKKKFVRARPDWDNSTSTGFAKPAIGDLIESIVKLRTIPSAPPPPPSPTAAIANLGVAMQKLGLEQQRERQFKEAHSRKRFHATINREKRAREIALENMRIYQRLVSVKATSTLKRDVQMKDWYHNARFFGAPTPSQSRANSRTSIWRPGGPGSIGMMPNQVFSSMYGPPPSGFSSKIAQLSGLIPTAAGAGRLRPHSAIAYGAGQDFGSENSYGIRSARNFEPPKHTQKSRPSSGTVRQPGIMAATAGSGSRR